jgi:hypothetical protein
MVPPLFPTVWLCLACCWSIIIQTKIVILDVHSVTVVKLLIQKNSVQVVVSVREQSMGLFGHLSFSLCFQEDCKKETIFIRTAAYFI